MSGIPPSSEPPPVYTQYPRGFSPYRAVPKGPKRFDLSVIEQAWRLAMQNLGNWFLALFLLGVVNGIFSLSENLVVQILGLGPQPGQVFPSAGAMAVRLAIALPGGIILGALRVGLFGLALKQIRGYATSPTDIFNFNGRFRSLLVASAILSFAVLVGLVCLIVPAILLGTLLFFTGPLVLDQQMPVRNALRLSWHTVRPHLWPAVGTLLVVSLASVSGVFLCCIGVLLTAPIAPLSQALLYDRFFGLDDDDLRWRQIVQPPAPQPASD